ncbi:MAG: hypothetical protein WDN00_01365 [Limisphaerales bacterium]
MIADDAQMTKKDFQHWVAGAYCKPLCGATVAWVAAGSPHGWELAQKWIDSKSPLIAAAGWGTLESLVSIKDDSELDLAELKRLLQRVQKTIHQSPDAARRPMNSFVIAVGSYVKSLTDTAMEIGEKIGPVTADMGNTACQMPFAPTTSEKFRNAAPSGRSASRQNVECRRAGLE